MRSFARTMKGGRQSLAGLNFGLLALGDRSYRRFCGFGRDFDRWLRQQGAQPLFDRVEVDNGDAGALRHWQGHLGRLADKAELPDWEAPRYQAWRLSARQLSNPGSTGWPCYRIELTPPAGTALDWQAGDIAEIGPQHAGDDVTAFLEAAGLDGAEPVNWNGVRQPLAEAVAGAILPTLGTTRTFTAQEVADLLRPLPHREYSIASLPADGHIALLVRRMRTSEGRPGLGSAWLTELASLDADIAVRVRANPSFRPAPDDRPLLLIGNGTGIAGLRSHLKDRARQERQRNWLIFGERQREHDFHYGEEIMAWQAGGMIERLDLAFSRDQEAKVYVQHRLRDAAEDVRAWIGAGAGILVCGSLEGMAPDVDAALAEILGAETLERLATEGRYRRDVY
jgi:sulfite reductase (NADPH) flavoprotein alpha-component